MQGRDDAGNPTVTFGPADTVYGFTYGTDLLGADVAATLKYVDSRIVDASQAVTFDVGARYRIGEQFVVALAATISAASSNLIRPISDAHSGLGGLGLAADEGMVGHARRRGPRLCPGLRRHRQRVRLAGGEAGRVALRLGLNTKDSGFGRFLGGEGGDGIWVWSP